MNINIFLKQFKMSNEDIVGLIAEGNPEIIGHEKLAGLLKILPQSEDVSLILDIAISILCSLII